MEANAKNQRPTRRRRLFLLMALIALLMLAGFFTFRSFLPSHPVLGPIYETSAFDLNEARSNRTGMFLRKYLPRRIVQSQHFPSRYKDQPRYLDLKGTQLEWSIGGTNTGWLYFWAPGIRPNVSGWEFAPSPETNLLSVTKLATDFVGSTNPRRVETFGDSSTINAIKVAVGQILFARRTNESTIYILKLKEQTGNKLMVDYCVATP